MTLLLDRTDTRKRLAQHGAILGAIALLLVAGRLANDSVALTVALIIAAGALFLIAAQTSQRFAATHQGHAILLQNNPLRGEKLFVDGVPVAKGRIGVTSEMRAPLPSGDDILVRTDAGLLTFRCRIEAVSGGSIQATDAHLIAEVRRRGLG